MTELIELPIITKGQYKNINLKQKMMNNELGIQVPLLVGEKHIEVEKMFPNGLKKQGQYGDYWIYRVRYLDQEVSFFLNKQNEADALDNLGDIGSKIKITGFVDDTGKFPAHKFNFELIQ